MAEFKFNDTEINGVYIIEPQVFGDARGFFMETYREDEFARRGIGPFVQHNHSSSAHRVLRGLHTQLKHPQGKLVRVIEGEVYDVAVDTRPGSETFGKWTGAVLSSENKLQFYIPPMMLHGFLVLSGHAQFIYSCTDYYHPEYEAGVVWNDHTLGIDWPIDSFDPPRLSQKDSELGSFADFVNLLNK